MDNEEFVRPWIDIANKDLALAEHVARTMRPTPYELVCFHCQQSAEEYLKSFLVLYDQEPPKTHNLIELSKLCEAFSSLFSEIFEKCEILTYYGVQPRYPNEKQIEKEDMIRSLEYAKAIKEFIKQQIPEMFKEENHA
jgi:HEPN domain-containing protein